ncbi:MAG: hypothetical protein QW139_02630 [Candidatus Micrarchaeaceae archaeon]
MELEKMTELEYKKYNEMNKIAHRPQRNAFIIGSFIGIIFFALFAYFGIRIVTFKSLMLILSYTNATVQSAHLNFTTNTSIATSIIKLDQNPMLQITYFLHNYAFTAEIENCILGIILIFFGYFAFQYFMDIYPTKYSVSTYKGLRRAIREKDAILKRLTKHGYTRKEIEWYFEVRSKIQELEKVIN